MIPTASLASLLDHELQGQGPGCGCVHMLCARLLQPLGTCYTCARARVRAGVCTRTAPAYPTSGSGLL